MLLGTRTFAASLRPEPAARALSGGPWWIGAILFMALPVLLFYPFLKLGARIRASWLFPQTITSQIMVWALLGSVLSLILFLLWHFLSNRKAGGTAATYGLAESDGSIDWPAIARELLLAAIIVSAGWDLVLASDHFFRIDFRFWILALKAPSPLQFGVFWRYVLPFAVFFLIQGTVLFGQLRLAKAGAPRRWWANLMLMAGGFLLFLALEYAPLFAGGTLLSPGEPLNTIVAIQFLPLMVVASLVSTWFFEKTGRIYAGAFINAMLVTWYIVAGQATQFPL